MERMIAFVVLLPLMVGPVWAQSDSTDRPLLSVNGSAEVRVEPDIATVRLGVVEEAATAREAQDGANRLAAGILGAIRGVGIPEDQVQTSRLTLTPIYSRSRPRAGTAPRIVGYRASNEVSVRVEELMRVGEVIDAGLGAGANQLQGVRFGLQDDRTARENALKQAIAEARRKAVAMADALGVELGPIISVQEGGVSIVLPMMEMGGRAMAMQEAVPTPVAPGDVRVSATVSIRYQIVQE